MKYNPEIHHRRSTRIKGYDYSQAGLYFITLCTYKRICLFGEIINMKMVLNEYGRIAEEELIKTSKMRPNIKLEAFIIMPNHIHGIIEIKGGRGTTHCDKGMTPHVRGTMHRAHMEERFGKPTSNTIPTIIRGYKSSVTKQINTMRKQHGVPVWQRNYYEHIIRNEKMHQQISEYIRNNPLQWADDKYNE